MKVVTVDQMRSLERSADAAGHSYAEMMERAGTAVAQALHERGLAQGRRVLVLVGPGNNGGDGLVAARVLHGLGAQVVCYVWKRDTRDDSNYRQASDLGIAFIRQNGDADLESFRQRLAESDVVVDALLGTGATGAPRGALAALLEALRDGLAALELPPPALQRPDRPAPLQRRRPFVVAVDLPSGLNADTGQVDPLTPRADLTVTFGYPKLGLFRFPGAEHVGELVVAEIGIPPALAADVTLELADPAMVRSLLPARPLDAHKGTFGRVMVVGGSPNYTGAPYMAAVAAGRVGAGLVTLAVPQVIQPAIAAKAVETTFLLLPSDLGALTPAATRVLGEALAGYRALLLGPGLGRERVTVDFVRELLGLQAAARRLELGFLAREAAPEAQPWPLPPTVIDADGLNALADTPDWWQHTRVSLVLTPHPGELARLRGSEIEAIQADRLAAAAEAAAAWGQIVVLKGAYTVVACPDGRATILPFANPALATAGTGDVLSGAIAGFLAQGLTPEAAAVAGAYVHGLAGELARQAMGEAGVLAGDLLPLLPEAMRNIRGGA